MIKPNLILGDCLEQMAAMPDNSVDSIVTDPPYGLSFMGKKWDYDVPSVEIWRQALRVLKPGGHLLAFAGTRTQHRMAVRIEDAGFEIRDMIAWVYGSGFPKSLNLDGDWKGWGTALKPALEPITVARKPLIGTVAANVLAHGTGRINVDGCRVGTENTQRTSNANTNGDGWGMGKVANLNGSNSGRWPANLIHDGSEEVLDLFPTLKSAGSARDAIRSSKESGIFGVAGGDGHRFGDTGSAARFFYCAKTSKKDRDEGLSFMPTVTADPYGQHRGRRMEDNDARFDGKPAAQGKNNHPTVKPTALMRYLCRLVTPPGGIVLDPFMGSGSTGKAAVLEGFDFIGIELNPEYFAIAEKRIPTE